MHTLKIVFLSTSLLIFCASAFCGNDPLDDILVFAEEKDVAAAAKKLNIKVLVNNMEELRKELISANGRGLPANDVSPYVLAAFRELDRSGYTKSVLVNNKERIKQFAFSKSSKFERIEQNQLKESFGKDLQNFRIIMAFVDKNKAKVIDALSSKGASSNPSLEQLFLSQRNKMAPDFDTWDRVGGDDVEDESGDGSGWLGVAAKLAAVDGKMLERWDELSGEERVAATLSIAGAAVIILCVFFC